MMDKKIIIQNILTNYGKYGITQKDVEPLIDEGLKDGLTYDRIYFILQVVICDLCRVEFFWCTPHQMAKAFDVHDERMLEIIKEAFKDFRIKEYGLDKPFRVPVEVAKQHFVTMEEKKVNKLQDLIDIADKEYDGHLTLMKFTGDWRCCFGTIDDRMKSYYMAYGETMDEAIDNCIKNKTDIYKIDTSIKAHDILSADFKTRIHHGTKYLDYIKPAEHNRYSKGLYRFLAQYPDYRFVQIFENAKSMKDAVFTIDPVFLFGVSSSIEGEHKLRKDEYLEGFSLETVVTPKKQFIQKKFRVDSGSCIVKNISVEFWENYILHGEDYLMQKISKGVRFCY